MKKFAYFALISLLSGFFQVQAQSTLQPRVHVATESFLGPGDQVVLRIADVDEIPDKPVTIDTAGFVGLPLIGQVHAAGLTTTQLQVLLVEKYRRFVTVPDVSVTFAAKANYPVSVVGEVNNPGVHPLGTAKTLLDVISLAGGLKPGAGPNVIVTRNPRWGILPGPDVTEMPDGYSTRTFALDTLMSSHASENNILIQPDDLLTIPPGEMVYVLGDVKKPGAFQLSAHPTMSLLQALSLAEGLGPEDSAGHARILRPLARGDGMLQEIPIDIPQIMAGKAPDVLLHANDVLFIPQSGVKTVSRRALEAAAGITAGILIYH